MSDEAQRWKEKYLQALEQHEQLEERWRAHVDLLRRSLVRSSYAVDGADPTVEQCMRELRDALRDDVPDDRLSALVPRLERAVLDTERNRQERLERLTRSLHRFVAQLQALPLPSEVRKPLKKFARQLDERAAQPLEWPELLAELGELQDRALTVQLAGAGKSAGLLSKLFGQREPSVESASEESAMSLSAIPAQTATDDTWAEDEGQTMVAQPLLVVADSGELADDPCEQVDTASAAFAAETMGNHILPVSPEHAYSAIAERVEAALYHLLDGLHLPEHQQPNVLTLRARIELGLNWYELVPLLDGLATDGRRG